MAVMRRAREQAEVLSWSLKSKSDSSLSGQMSYMPAAAQIARVGIQHLFAADGRNEAREQTHIGASIFAREIGLLLAAKLPALRPMFLIAHFIECVPASWGLQPSPLARRRGLCLPRWCREGRPGG